MYLNRAHGPIASFAASPFSVLCHTVNKIKYGKNWRNKERKNEPSGVNIVTNNRNKIITEKGRPAKEANGPMEA